MMGWDVCGLRRSGDYWDSCTLTLLSGILAGMLGLRGRGRGAIAAVRRDRSGDTEGGGGSRVCFRFGGKWSLVTAEGDPDSRSFLRREGCCCRRPGILAWDCGRCERQEDRVSSCSHRCSSISVYERTETLVLFSSMPFP